MSVSVSLVPALSISDYNLTRYIYDISWPEAPIFIEISESLQERYGLLSSVRDLCGVLSEIWVVEDPFCRLVETIVAEEKEADETFYAYMRRAVGVYEGIKGERYDWQWRPLRPPGLLQPWRPLNDHNIRPERNCIPVRGEDEALIYSIFNGHVPDFMWVQEALEKEYACIACRRVHLENAEEIYLLNQPFCELVEKVTTTKKEANEETYKWAKMATAIYEVLKGEQFDWSWRPLRLQAPFLPIRYAHPPMAHSKRAVTPKGVIELNGPSKPRR